VFYVAKTSSAVSVPAVGSDGVRITNSSNALATSPTSINTAEIDIYVTASAARMAGRSQFEGAGGFEIGEFAGGLTAAAATAAPSHINLILPSAGTLAFSYVLSGVV
jgi:acyl-CoA hydrolase